MRKNLIRIGVGALFFVGALIALPRLFAVGLPLMLISYFILSYDVLLRAAKNILHGQVFDENFLMAIAGIGALLIGEYPEAVAVMLFYQIGEQFQDYAVGKSRKSIRELMDIRPDYANLLVDGETRRVAPFEVGVGDVILIRPGERIPLDGTVQSGSSSLDVSALTGESVPRDVTVGDTVLSGSINRSGVLTVVVEKEFSESTASKILDLVENAGSKKAKSEKFITRFAAVYTPIVVIGAVLLAVVPSLFTGEWSVWIYRALSFLVVSCPCALVISVPLSFFGGLGAASGAGILIKGSNYLEALARLETVVLDKTGTLTQGIFRVREIHAADGFAESELLCVTAHAEGRSTHPIAEALRGAYGKELNMEAVEEISEMAGLGIVSTIGGVRVLAGNGRLMQKYGLEPTSVTLPGTVVHVGIGDRYAGYLRIADEEKEDAKDALAALHAAGVKNTVMLTGDTASSARAYAERLGISRYEAELLPADKVAKVESYLAQKSRGTSLAFVGDGINDAPVLARADVGIAMGALGSDAAIEAADVVIMDDGLQRIPLAIRIARKTERIVKQNIVFAIGIKVTALLLVGCGIASMWLAVFADVGVSVLAVLNAMRALRYK